MTQKQDTRLVMKGRDPEHNFGIVNPPVYHASTIIFPSLDEMESGSTGPFDGVRYGRMGTPTTFALEEAVADLEGGYRTVSVGSGLSGITLSLLAFLKAGDHLLMVDSAYEPTRKFCNGILAGYGIETTYYHPTIGAGIKDLMRPNTRVVFTESPGSLTFEVQDIPAIAEVAHAQGAIVMIDNTWSAGYFFKPFDHGVDISIQAATKFIVGHSDAMLGTVTAKTKDLWLTVKGAATALGVCAGPDDAYLGLRGLRTLGARMARHQASGLLIADWLCSQAEVQRVLHPALPSCPGHGLWKRDFTGCCGLFSVELKQRPRANMAALLDHMELFGLGFSWGGYESLIVPAYPARVRTAKPWPDNGPMIRLHVGLEDPEDLIADLDAGLKRFSAA